MNNRSFTSFGLNLISIDHKNHKIDNCVILDDETFFIRGVNDKFDKCNGVIWNMGGHTFNLWGETLINSYWVDEGQEETTKFPLFKF